MRLHGKCDFVQYVLVVPGFRGFGTDECFAKRNVGLISNIPVFPSLGMLILNPVFDVPDLEPLGERREVFLLVCPGMRYEIGTRSNIERRFLLRQAVGGKGITRIYCQVNNREKIRKV